MENKGIISVTNLRQQVIVEIAPVVTQLILQEELRKSHQDDKGAAERIARIINEVAKGIKQPA